MLFAASWGRFMVPEWWNSANISPDWATTIVLDKLYVNVYQNLFEMQHSRPFFETMLQQNVVSLNCSSILVTPWQIIRPINSNSLGLNDFTSTNDFKRLGVSQNSVLAIWNDKLIPSNTNQSFDSLCNYDNSDIESSTYHATREDDCRPR